MYKVTFRIDAAGHASAEARTRDWWEPVQIIWEGHPFSIASCRRDLKRGDMFRGAPVPDHWIITPVDLEMLATSTYNLERYKFVSVYSIEESMDDETKEKNYPVLKKRMVD